MERGGRGNLLPELAQARPVCWGQLGDIGPSMVQDILGSWDQNSWVLSKLQLLLADDLGQVF